MAKIGPVQRANMFAPTAEVIHHGHMIAEMYPVLGDLTQVDFRELLEVCYLRSIDPTHVQKALLALTHFDITDPDQETAEAFAAAKATLAADLGKTHQEAWPATYTCHYFHPHPPASSDRLTIHDASS